VSSILCNLVLNKGKQAPGQQEPERRAAPSPRTAQVLTVLQHCHTSKNKRVHKYCRCCMRSLGWEAPAAFELCQHKQGPSVPSLTPPLSVREPCVNSRPLCNYRRACAQVLRQGEPAAASMAPNAAVALVAALLVVCAHAQASTVHDQLNAVACGLTGLVGSPFRRPVHLYSSGPSEMSALGPMCTHLRLNEPACAP